MIKTEKGNCDNGELHSVTKKEKVKAWLKRHTEHIIIGAASVALVYGGVAIKNKEKGMKALQSVVNIQAKEINRLQNLCEEKDNNSKQLMSELLRKGNPLGGEHMAKRKQYLKVA